MNHFRKISITGFKSIEHQTVELSDLNVVIGANGSGKSNLIGAFKLLERVASQNLQLYVGEQGGADRFFHHGQKITPTLSIQVEPDLAVYAFQLKPAFGDTLIFQREEMRRQHDKEQQRIERDSGHRESEFRQRPSFSQFSDFSISHFSDTSDSAACKRLCDIDDNRSLRSDAANLAAFLYWIQQIHPTNYRRIVEHIRAVAPFFEDFTLAPSRHNPGKIKLEWKQRGSDAYFDAYSLSDGTLRFICLCVLLLQPEPPALIILDEPELGLHPAAIHLLAEMVEAASRQGQVLLATQSVTLLDHFDPAAVIVAEHDGRQSTFRRLSPEDLSQWLEDFSLGELWEKNVIGGRP